MRPNVIIFSSRFPNRTKPLTERSHRTLAEPSLEYQVVQRRVESRANPSWALRQSKLSWSGRASSPVRATSQPRASSQAPPRVKPSKSPTAEPRFEPSQSSNKAEPIPESLSQAQSQVERSPESKIKHISETSVDRISTSWRVRQTAQDMCGLLQIPTSRPARGGLVGRSPAALTPIRDEYKECLLSEWYLTDCTSCQNTECSRLSSCEHLRGTPADLPADTRYLPIRVSTKAEPSPKPRA